MLHAYVSGEITLPAANRCADELIAATIQHTSSQILIDGRQLHGCFNQIDRYQHTDHFAQIVLDAQSMGKIQQLRISIFAISPILDPNRFGQNVARNRGVDILCTDQMDQAKSWLGIL